jgi:hypothetical protein
MIRILSVAALAVALVFTGTAEAKQKKKNTPTEITAGGTVAGTVKSISDDGKTITVEAPGTKKAPGASTDVKLPKQEKIEYVGLEDDEKKKLADDPKGLVGYAVTITLEDGSKDTAGSMQVSKASTTTPKKKKKKNS